MRCNLFTRSWGVVGLLPFLICAILAGSTQALGHVVGAVSSSIDPDKAPSELNHHLAGYALIGVGLFVLIGITIPKLRAMQLVWPSLFIAAGVFLAVWSDAEIWPRGNLSWTWLFHHDAEARQHKVYAVLLIAMGLLEYLRNRGALKGFWRIGAFPILAILGAGLLLVHDHNGTSGVRSPEVTNYLVNPALDFDGKPWPAISSADSSYVLSELSNEPLPAEARSSTAIASDAIFHNSTAPVDSLHPQGAGPADKSARLPHREMNHSSMQMDGDAISMSESRDTGHHHHMSPSMGVVQREHFWFMIVGLGIALFKLLSDADLRHPRFLPYFWPSATILLGVLLALYRE